MGALFLKDLADKTRRGLRGRVEAGKSGGGNCYGYDVVRRLGSDGQPVRGERKINECEAGIVRRIFNEYASGKSPQAIAKQFNKESIPGPSNKAWGPSTIHGNPDRGTGILNNELYIGRLIWNRLRYIKDPQTGKRVSRLNPESEWIIQDVPELRVIDPDLWDKVKARQQSLRSNRKGKKAAGYWDRRRPRFIFSGLMECGCCGGGYINLNAERVGCSAARAKGTCDNRRTMRREEMETLVLEALHHHLMDPALCDAFCAEYTRHMNKLHADRNAHRKTAKNALAKAERELDRLVKAIMDGIPASRVKDRMVELEARTAELEAQLAEGEDETVLVHPKMAGYYREQIGRLREALTDESRRPEATALIRKLIDKIGTRPVK
ncbi:MAG: recombinase family protein [Alphaproteobacteria bacterium]